MSSLSSAKVRDDLLWIFGENSSVRALVNDRTKKFTLTKYKDLRRVFNKLTSADVELLDMCYRWEELIDLSEEQSNRLTELDQYLDMPVVKYLKFNWGYQLTCVVARAGDFYCLKYLHDHGCPCDELTCSIAAGHGQLKCLKYLHEQDCPWDSSACHSAARGGHLECLKYLHAQGCPWGAWTCCSAAEGGHLECLKYLHAQGCPWDTMTCSMAATNGQLECLEFLHEHGCPWDTMTCSMAQVHNHLDCLKYAIDNGCPAP